MGFEIDNENANSKWGEAIATSSKKIGTVTFIKKNTKEFVALGHSTIKEKNKTAQVTGTCYDVNFEGINKGTYEATGNLIASLNKSSELGHIYYDKVCGIFGTINSIDRKYIEVETACWYNVKKGNANLLLSFDNEEELKSYSVEITNIDYINKNKNIKVKITDPNLLFETGGVVQGMSGTPLMQNGKLIGAINYVNADDPSIAYAVFVDKLL